jgi:hypothetical protein
MTDPSPVRPLPPIGTGVRLGWVMQGRASVARRALTLAIVAAALGAAPAAADTFNVKRKTILVKAGKRYLARAGR